MHARASESGRNLGACRRGAASGRVQGGWRGFERDARGTGRSNAFAIVRAVGKLSACYVHGCEAQPDTCDRHWRVPLVGGHIPRCPLFYLFGGIALNVVGSKVILICELTVWYVKLLKWLGKDSALRCYNGF